MVFSELTKFDKVFFIYMKRALIGRVGTMFGCFIDSINTKKEVQSQNQKEVKTLKTLLETLRRH